MFDINDVAQRFRGRAEVRSGVVRRRRWSDEEKGKIISEAVAPGAVIAAVARRHELTPQHLSNWIRCAKEGRIALPGEESMRFVPVIAGGEKRSGKAAKPRRSGRFIEIVLGSVTVRIPDGADARTIETVLRAVWRTGA